MIVHVCGNMCVPEDVCMYMLAKKLGPLKTFELYQMEGGVGGGGTTFVSGYVAYQEMLAEEIEVIVNPFSLGGLRKCGIRKQDEDPEEATEDPNYPGVWLSGGHSTPCALRTLRRTCELFDNDGDDAPKYGEEVSINSRYCFTKSSHAKHLASTTKEPKDVCGLIKHAKTIEEAMKKGQLPPPGGGATFQARAHGFFECLAIAESETGEWAHVRFQAPDPFEFSALAAVTGALVLADPEEAKLNKQRERGGVLTPGYAFAGSTFIERLQATPYANTKGRSVSIELKEGKPGPKLLEERAKNAEERNQTLNFKRIKGEIEGSWAPPELLM